MSSGTAQRLTRLAGRQMRTSADYQSAASRDHHTHTLGYLPRLIVLNGPPGSGTLAERYVEEHPLTLDLDIDRIRDVIASLRDDPSTAGRLARAVALSVARTHLAEGYDVVIPQFLGRAEFLEQVEQLAGNVGAESLEIVLLDSQDNALSRFAERTRGATARLTFRRMKC
jgi:hypothetical protein